MTLLLLALALAMDAFAVAVCNGAKTRPGLAGALPIGLTFGAAQGLMPLAGWALGTTFAGAIDAWDHWIAFALLGLLGIKMIGEGLDTGDESGDRPLAGRALLVAAIATSIDAAAAGLTLDTLGVPVMLACLAIAGVTALLATIGALFGAAIGTRFGKRAEIAGGLVLIGIGLRIVAEHTGLLHG